MSHAQKPEFVFRRYGRIHLNRRRASVQSTTGSRGVRIGGSNAGYTMLRGSVKSTGYPPPFASFPFTSPPVSHRVPSHFSWTLHHHIIVYSRAESIYRCYQELGKLIPVHTLTVNLHNLTVNLHNLPYSVKRNTGLF